MKALFYFVLLFFPLSITLHAQTSDEKTKAKTDSLAAVAKVKADSLKAVAAKAKADSLKAQAVKDSLGWWKTGGITGLSFSQASYTNWAAGGQNSLTGTGLVTLFANYKKRSITWDNILELAYGKTELGGTRPRKSDDKIDFSSKFGHKVNKKLSYTSLFNFKSQFDEGFNYPNDSVVVSRFMAPGYFVLALGMDYVQKDYFSLFIGPLTGKVTVVNDQRLADQGSFGVQKAVLDAQGNVVVHGKEYLEEFGAYLKATFKKDIMKNINLMTKLELFSNYMVNPQNIVVNWETLVSMKVNKFFSARISTQLMYDDKVNTKIDKNGDGIYEVNGPRVQFKEIFYIGIFYKF